MFHADDRYALFTRDQLADRLGDVCSVEWFLREYRVPVRCKGRVIAGADILRALETPPPPETTSEPPPSSSRVVSIPSSQQRKRQGAGFCAEMKPLTTQKPRE